MVGEAQAVRAGGGRVGPDGILRPLVSIGRFEGAVPEDVIAHAAGHVRAWDIPVTEGAAGIETILRKAHIALRRDPRGLTVEIAAPDRVELHVARESVFFLLDHLVPGAGQALDWTGEVEAEGHPPGFHTARVLSVARVAPRFLRVTLSCAGTARLLQGGMHVSLLLPPEGRDPVWPRVAASGRTVWPSGADALHRAAYTLVEPDPAALRFAVDIFEHAGGRTAAWAASGPEGQVIGLTGPGGGDFPEGSDLLMAGDETALPAIRRILAASAPGRTGRVLIEVGGAEDVEDLAAPAGMAIRWLLRDRGESLGQWLDGRPGAAPGPETFVWVAAEQALARRARLQFREGGLPRTRGYFSGYWSA